MFIIIIIIICLDPTSSFRQYFNLYRAFSQRGGERTRNDRREKKCQQNPTAPTASTVDPCPHIIQLPIGKWTRKEWEGVRRISKQGAVLSMWHFEELVPA